MAQERQAPDVLITQTNLSGVVADIDEDPDSPDANWLTADSDGADTVCRVSFPTPSQDLNPATDVQEFRAWIRRSASGGQVPSASMVLYDGGSAVRTLVTLTSGITTAGVMLVGVWSASEVGDMADVGCLILGNATSRTVEIGAIEWNAEISILDQQNVSDGTKAGDVFAGAYEFDLDLERVLAGDSATSVFPFFLVDTAVGGDSQVDEFTPAPVTGEVVITFN